MVMKRLRQELLRKQRLRDRQRSSRELSKKLLLPKLRLELKRRGADRKKNAERRRPPKWKNRCAWRLKLMREKDSCNNKWRLKGSNKWNNREWSK